MSSVSVKDTGFMRCVGTLCYWEISDNGCIWKTNLAQNCSLVNFVHTERLVYVMSRHRLGVLGLVSYDSGWTTCLVFST